MITDDFKTTRVYLDFIDDPIRDVLAAVGDIDGRGIELVVRIDDIPATDLSVTLKWIHENATAGENKLEHTGNGLYKLIYPTEMLVKGTINAQFSITDGKVTLQSRKFDIKVLKDVYDKALTSCDKRYEKLIELVAKIDFNTFLTKEKADSLYLPIDTPIGDGTVTYKEPKFILDDNGNLYIEYR